MNLICDIVVFFMMSKEPRLLIGWDGTIHSDLSILSMWWHFWSKILRKTCTYEHRYFITMLLIFKPIRPANPMCNMDFLNWHSFWLISVPILNLRTWYTMSWNPWNLSHFISWKNSYSDISRNDQGGSRLNRIW